MGTTMTVRVLFFASCRDIMGEREREMALPEGTVLADLIEALGIDNPRFAQITPSLMVSVNQDYVERDHVLCDGDEVAFIPPVSGGR